MYPETIKQKNPNKTKDSLVVDTKCDWSWGEKRPKIILVFTFSATVPPFYVWLRFTNWIPSAGQQNWNN